MPAPIELNIKLPGAKEVAKRLGISPSRTAELLEIVDRQVKNDGDIPVGSSIKFEMTLPAKVLGTPRDVKVRCTGHVTAKNLNVTKRGKKRAVSCVIDTYQFIRQATKV